ncbi:unnamed protein product [Amoebophrya sp. A120]|nr:unnamed protein product [Amoebophrya sp. A120]|eukprot:GSA120T00022231001.1
MFSSTDDPNSGATIEPNSQSIRQGGPDETTYLYPRGKNNQGTLNSRLASSGKTNRSSYDTASSAKMQKMTNASTFSWRPNAGEVVIQEVMNEKVRARFAKKVLGLTCAMLFVVAIIIVLFKMSAYYAIMRVPITTDVAHFPLTLADEDFLKTTSKMYIMTIKIGRVDHNFADAVRAVHDRSFYVSLGFSLSAIVVGLTLYCTMICCCRNVMRKAPHNVILCFGFAVLWGFALQLLCFSSEWTDIMMASSFTAILVLVLWSAAQCCRLNLSRGGAIWLLICSLFVFFIVVTIAIPLWNYGTMRFNYKLVLLNCFFLVLLSTYLMVLFQMIIGGKHTRHQFAVDDYAFAALLLFVDIVDVLVLLLECCGIARRTAAA